MLVAALVAVLVGAGVANAAEKGVRDTSCRGSGGVSPSFKKSPQDWGIQGIG